ncbi:MAG: sugar transferase [Lachnospiraceae bacterium]|nr:sugar transferase [Lachnospiraceae bacterium]
MYEKYIKRILDIILSLIGIIVFSPVMLLIAILVKKKLGSPVIFKQPRPGKNEKIFYMYKFRSMTDKKDKDGKLLPDKIRVTEFGKKLRESSLDELPELINILKGDMSIVGPRPQLVKDMVFMTLEQRKRHKVRQGLTGLAQINGRNSISWEEKLEYDLEYVENITFLRDLKIIIRTIFKVLKKDGITTYGMETAEDYGEYLLRKGFIDNIVYGLGLKEEKEIINGLKKEKNVF